VKIQTIVAKYIMSGLRILPVYLGIVPAHDGYHHDPSACLVDDGEILAFVEEERMIRKKHARGTFPINAIDECLSIADVDLTDISKIGLSRNYDDRRKGLFRLSKRAIKSNIGIAEKMYDALILPIKQTAVMTNGALLSLTENRLVQHFSVAEDDIPPIICLNHQFTHAASAFYPSGFDEALVVSIDNYGGHLSGSVYAGTEGKLEELESFLRFNSIGRFYSDITAFLGFRRSNGEGKVMGLAPYGKKNEDIERVIQSYVNIRNGAYDTEALTFRKMGDAVDKLEADLGINARYWLDDITQDHKDVAFHAQEVLEEAVASLVSHYISDLDTGNVCLAGGVALNCKMNKRIREIPDVNDIFVQPAANDAGGSLGAAVALAKDAGTDIRELKHVNLGREFSNPEIHETLQNLKLPFNEIQEVPETVASLISEGKIVGWFQGRMEAGPRALGNRSILADPRSIESRDNVNKHVKHREGWRPFAPSMLLEEADRYLIGSVSKAAHFMTDTYDTTPEARENIPAVLHPRDKTTRPQIVTRSQNELYFKLLKRLKDKTGIGVVLNTSFNDNGEPIVRTPDEAIRNFYSMGLDVLVINNLMLQKPQQNSDHLIV
jgi:carbamoyltransferase